jgi:YHS domain-containing protein
MIFAFNGLKLMINIVSRYRLRAICGLVLIFMPFSANADEPVSKNFLTGIAIGGHDSVAYHRPGSSEPHQAIEGNKTWKVEWKGADWLFSSKTDRDLFAANPERYSPAYNGFCANALSLGEGLIKTDGRHWQIFGGRLYTFYAARGRERWLSGDFEVYKKVADKAWKEIIGE